MKTIDLLVGGIALLFSACADHTHNNELVNNKASLPHSFHFDDLGLKVINSSINKKQVTMSVLYGNDLALKTAIGGIKEIRAGEVFTLVTWKQQQDDYWFGANIPGELQSVELLKTVSSNGNYPISNYQRFEGKDLALNPDTLHQQKRIKYIFDQKPSIMP
jgi:hypothetical protein